MPRQTVTILVTLVAAASLCVGCSDNVDSEPGGYGGGDFYCESDSDCLTSRGYLCNTETHQCVDSNSDEEHVCNDTDGDGFGTGPNRQGCVNGCEGAGGDNCEQYAQQDCDDSDPDVHPDAAEYCDGKINDCNSPATSESEAFACSTDISKCPKFVQRDDERWQFVRGSCEDGQCIYAPLNEAACSVDGEVVRLTCVDGEDFTWKRDPSKSFEDLPRSCSE